MGQKLARNVQRESLHLRGAAGSCGSFAFEGCISVSGMLAAEVHNCRALQGRSMPSETVCRLLWSEDARALSRAETDALWA